jgi:hypothetical protein
MALPASGAISFSQMAAIVYNNASATVSLNDSDIRTLLGVASGSISISSGRSKPTAATYTYTTPGTYSLVVPAYESMGIGVWGAGQGGNGGTGSDTCTGWCGQFCFFPFCCNGAGGAAGASGGDSYFRVGSINVTANGGTSSANGGGYGGTVTTGGGAAGGTAGVAYGCSGSAGSIGKNGGLVTYTVRKGSTGPAYGASCSIAVGAGGAGGFNAGGAGGGGAVNVDVT